MAERRRFIRVDQPIRVRYRQEAGQESEGQSLSKNIGRDGICLRLTQACPVGASLKLTLNIPGVYPAVEARAKVVWTRRLTEKDGRPGRGLEAGLVFTSISSAARASLVNFVYESLKRRAEKTG